jgi:hypothetical protein
VECFDADPGYFLLEKTIKVTPHPGMGGTAETCGSGIEKSDHMLDVTGQRVCVAQVNNTPFNGDRQCSLIITATEAKVEWVPPPPSDKAIPPPASDKTK